HLQHAFARLRCSYWQFLPQLSEADAQQCQALTEIVVQLPRDARAFFLLRMDQPPCQCLKRFPCLLALGNVDPDSPNENLARIVFERELISQPGAGFSVGAYRILGNFYRVASRQGSLVILPKLLGNRA